MRKIVASHFLSLDGVAEQPDEFVTAWDDEVDEYGTGALGSQDAVLLGRRTFDEWSQFWPTSEIEPFATFINSVDKFVASSTLSNPTWAKSTVVTGDVVDFVRNLKGMEGGDIALLGSIELTQSLFNSGLVDELRLCVAPVMQLRGRHLFDKGPSRQLTLTRHVATPSGYLLLDYAVDNGL